MYSYTDFECLFVHYKLEGVPVDVSIEQFCLSNQVLITCLQNGTRISERR